MIWYKRNANVEISKMNTVVVTCYDHVCPRLLDHFNR